MSIISLIQMICLVVVITATAVLAIAWISECWMHIEEQYNSKEGVEEWWS